MKIFRFIVPIFAFACLELSVSACRPRSPSATEKSKQTAWQEVQKQRQQEFDDYIKRRPESWDWFLNRPLGVSGTPLVVLRALMDFYPDIWATNDPKENLGFPARPGDYDKNGKLKNQRLRQGLPFGFGWVKDPRETNPDRQTLNAFFTCAGCHTGRVIVNGKVQLIPGGPSTEVEPQKFARLQKDTAKKFIYKFSADPALVTAGLANLGNFYSYLGKLRQEIATGKRSPNFFFGGKMYEGEYYGANGYTVKDEKYYRDIVLEELDKLLLEKNKPFFMETMKKFMSTFVKVDVMYNRLATSINYHPANGVEPPPLHGPKPGQMDPWGLVQGNIVLNAIRDDQASWLGFVDNFYKDRPNDHAVFFGSTPSADPKTRYGQALANLVGRAGGLIEKKELSEADIQKDVDLIAKWYSNHPGNVDIRPLWHSKDQYWANWDGNQQEASRTLASGVSAVGDPRAVDVEMHSAMNEFIADLPSPAYPFEVDMTKAARGEAVFNENCASCHAKLQKKVYDVGTDRNRLLQVGKEARLGLIALTQEACSIYVNANKGKPNKKIDDFEVAPDWCITKDPATLNDLYVGVDRDTGARSDGLLDAEGNPLNPKVGFKSGPLHGIWASSPYLHNGSVPTLWHMLNPAERPQKFIRGNINYDTKNVGFKWQEEPKASDYPAGENVHYSAFDSTQNGNSNAGHPFGTTLPVESKWDLIEYLKTL